MPIAYIGFGSNLGDRDGYIRQALSELASTDGITLLRVSSLYETAPVGYTNQGKFLNGVAEIETSVPPHTLLALLKGIEAKLGRQHRVRWGPREIDLDILIYGERQISTPELTIPHPEMQRRGFVLIPLAELAPNLCHPVLGKRIAELLKDRG